MDIKYTELKKKEVFNVFTGENYGKIQDLIINEKSGVIESIIVPGKKSNFLSCESLEIKFCEIEKIGKDAVLIKRGSCKKDACDICERCGKPKPCDCNCAPPVCCDDDE